MLGSLAAAFTLGGLLILSQGSANVLGAAALVTGAVLSLSAAGYHLLTVRLRKISIRRWLRR